MALFRGKAANYVGGEQPPFQITADVLNNDVAFAAAAMEYLRTLVGEFVCELCRKFVTKYTQILK